MNSEWVSWRLNLFVVSFFDDLTGLNMWKAWIFCCCFFPEIPRCLAWRSVNCFILLGSELLYLTWEWIGLRILIFGNTDFNIGRSKSLHFGLLFRILRCSGFGELSMSFLKNWTFLLFRYLMSLTELNLWKDWIFLLLLFPEISRCLAWRGSELLYLTWEWIGLRPWSSGILILT